MKVCRFATPIVLPLTIHPGLRAGTILRDAQIDDDLLHVAVACCCCCAVHDDLHSAGRYVGQTRHVDNAAIAGAVLAGATTVIAVDIDDRKLEWARGFGATHTINSTQADPVTRIREFTGGHGADVVIDAAGLAQTYRQAFQARDLAGRVVLVGVPTPGTEITLPLDEVFGRGGALTASWYGDCLPSRDFPMLIDLYPQGRFNLDDFVSETIALDDVNAAIGKMLRGDVLRSVVVFEES